ncbi:ABC transporter ATP-binding protein [Nanoarchaeota archaeon]
MKRGAVIELKNVWKTYMPGEVPVHALRGLTLKIPNEDFVVVLGSSGSGKSTAMNMIGALDIPSKGTIYLEGKDISKLDESDLAQIRGKKIGFIFQQFNLIPSLDALHNVTLPMIFQRYSYEERKARAEELLKLVGLGERMYHKPKELSGGEQQRVAIARSLANNPDVILADEPTGNLDTKTGEQIMEILCKLHKEEKKTVIMVTHDLDLVKYAHRVIYLKDGQVLKERIRKR